MPGSGLPVDELPQPEKVRQFREALARSLLYDRLYRSAEDSTTAAKDAHDEAAAVRKERGLRADDNLRGSYKALADQESNAAYWFRLFAMGLVLLSVVAGALVGAYVPNSSALEGVVHQLAAVAVVLGLAGYCARQSAHHRNVAVWADVTTLHLTTFDDFVSPIVNLDLRESIRQQFASKLYGSMAAESAQKLETASADITWMQHMITTMVAANAQKKTPPSS